MSKRTPEAPWRDPLAGRALTALLLIAALTGCRQEPRGEAPAVQAPEPTSTTTAAAPQPAPRSGGPLSEAAISAYNRGLAHLERCQYAEAERALASAHAHAPDSAPVLTALTLARYYQGGDLQEETRAMERIAAASPERAAPRYVLGHLLLKRRLYDDALRAFEATRERLSRPDSFVAYSAGTTAREAGDHARAAARFAEAAQIEPTFRSAWYALAQVLLDLNREGEGDAALRRFESLQGTLWIERFEFRYRGMGPLMLAPALPRRHATADARARAPVYRPAACPADPAGAQPGEPHPARQGVCFPGAGAAVFDADGDGDLDLYEARCQPEVAPAQRPLLGRLLIQTAEGAFEDHTDAAGLRAYGLGMAAVAGDVDGDGDPDLVVSHTAGLSLFENDGGRFTDVTAAAGLRLDGWRTGLSLIDVDHDGDLDLYAAGFVTPPADDPGGADGPLSERPPVPDQLLENLGSGAFRDISASSGVQGPPTRSLGALWTDLDGDHDVDLLQLDITGPTRALLNQRDRTFREAPEGLFDVPGEVSGAAVTDIDGDGRLDLIFSHWRGAAVSVRRTTESGKLEPALSAAFGALPEGPAFGVTGADPHGSGRPGALVVVGDAIWFVDPLAAAGDAERAARVSLPETGGLPRGIVPVDLNQDGAEDLVVTSAGGATPLLNTRHAEARWLRVTLDGRMSNRDGFGSVIEAHAISARQARYVGGAAYLSGRPNEALFTFPGASAADFVRVTWPSGIRQPLVDVALGRPLEILEEGLKSSCPLLFTWDGARYRFISDLLGAAALGISIGGSTPIVPDHDELIALPPGALAEEDGAYRLRLIEHLEELVYTDQVRLLAVDHLDHQEVVARERYQYAPPRDATGMVVLADPSPPHGALDDRGNNVIEALRELDTWAVDTFDHAPHAGFAERHALILDLGEADPGEPVTLILDGWTRYATVGEMERAMAAGRSPLGPVLEVDDGDGRWRVITSDVGLPAGLPKTMLLSLDGAFRSRRQRVRLSSNLLVFWDRIRVDRAPREAPTRIHPLIPRAARLWSSGIPLATRPGEAEALAYDGQRFRPSPWTKLASGRATRLGDVTELVTQRDDRLVISGPGEALDLSFAADALPSVAPGLRRSWFVHVEGWIKDQEPSTVSGDTIGPLPWRDMPAYPYTPRDPGSVAGTDAQRVYDARWNSRPLPRQRSYTE